MNWGWLMLLVVKLLGLFRGKSKLAQWQTRRDETRIRLKGIDDALIDVTIQLLQAKKNGHNTLSAGLDMRRERLFKDRADCKRDYDYYDRRCDAKG